jgi:hypothetical protein
LQFADPSRSPGGGFSDWQIISSSKTMLSNLERNTVEGLTLVVVRFAVSHEQAVVVLDFLKIMEAERSD